MKNGNEVVVILGIVFFGNDTDIGKGYFKRVGGLVDESGGATSGF